MRRLISVLILLAIGVIQPLAAAGIEGISERNKDSETVVAYPWIVRFFGSAVAGWILGKGFDAALDRARATRLGRAALRHLDNLSTGRSLSAADQRTIYNTQLLFQNVVTVLERGDYTDQEARRRIAALEQTTNVRITQLLQDLAALEARLHRIEVEQRLQLRMIIDLQGEIVSLRHQLADLDGRIFAFELRYEGLQDHLGLLEQRTGALEGRTDALETRTTRLEGIVDPDPNRYLRHGLYFSVVGLYGDAPVLTGDGRLGGGMALQVNLARRIGVFGEAHVLPVTASDISGPDGSSLAWITIPVTVGAALSVLPPQSPLSVQVSGGAGMSWSVLRYYPPDFSSDSLNWEHIHSVSNAVLSGKLELGATAPLAMIEPVIGLGYLRFLNPLMYEGRGSRSNAGQELWFVSLGIRFRSKLPGTQGERRILSSQRHSVVGG